MTKEKGNHINPSFILKNVLLVLLILILSTAIGMMIGYSLLGYGDNPLEVFRPSLWIEVFHLLY